MNGETPQLSGGAYVRLVALGAAVGGGHAPLEGIGGGATPVEYVPGRRRCSPRPRHGWRCASSTRARANK